MARTLLARTSSVSLQQPIARARCSAQASSAWPMPCPRTESCTTMSCTLSKGLAAKVEKQRLAAAAPLLAQLSEVTRTTSCLVLDDGTNAVVAAVHEGGDGFLRVTYRLGVRHPLTRGAPGLAILSARTPSAEELPGVTLARMQGFALTRGELQPGAVGIAAPIPAQAVEAAVSIVALHELPADAAEQIVACAQDIGALWA